MPRFALVTLLALVLLGVFVSRSFCVAAPSGVPGPPPSPVVQQDLGAVRAVVPPLPEIAPSIFGLSDEHVSFTWLTREESVGRVQLVTEAGPIEQLEEAPTRYHHLTISGLRPGTHYAYTVDGRFHGAFDTHRPDAPYRFVVFGHPGGTHAPAGYPFGALASRLDGLDPAFALCTGDLCYYTNAASFEELYFDVFEDFLSRRPIYVSPGNHEAGFPTSEGIGFEVFRRLFPYDFGGEHYAYHSFVQGNVEFFACAYGPAKVGLFEAQVEWLRRGLAESRSEFRVVFLGGAQDPMGFDRELFFRTAAEGGADFVFGGDGSGAKVTEEAGLKFFFAGTNNAEPHDFFLVQTEPYRLEVTRYDVPMAGHKGSWVFDTRREKQAVFDARPFGRKGRAPGAALYGPLKLSSDAFHGVEVHVHNPFERNAVVWLRWAPERLVRPRRDYHYREEARHVPAGETAVFQYALPAALPRTGEPWTLGELEVRIGGPKLPADFDMTEHVRQLTVFADPLKLEPKLESGSATAPR